MDVLGAELVLREERRNPSYFDGNVRQTADGSVGSGRNPGRQLLVWTDDFVIADAPFDGCSRPSPEESERFGRKSALRLAAGLVFGDEL